MPRTPKPQPKPDQARKAMYAWVTILCVAVVNGGFREEVLIPALGKSVAYPISGLVLCALILLVAYTLIRSLKGLPEREALRVGLGWVCLTLAFEFMFGRLIQQKTWTDLMDAYAFRDGNLWPVVLIVTALAPWLASHLYNTRGKRR